MALRKERQALSLGLGDAVLVATHMEKREKELSREFRVANRKGVRSQTTVVKRQQARQRREDKARERAYNPRIKGLENVPGVTVDADGTIGLEELRKQRPDIFDMRPIPIEGAPPGFMEKLHQLILASGREDKYYDRFKRD